MNPVEYTLLIQRICAIFAGLSFLLICIMLAFLNPYSNNFYIWAILATILVLLGSLTVLISFWWFFSIKKSILTIIQVNQVIYQSFISASCLVFLMVLNQVTALNIFTILAVLAGYILYQVWANSDKS